MSHHHHHHEHSHDAEHNLGVVFWLNAIFVIIEVIGGFFTNSIAILSDALHDFGDCCSLGLAWWLQRKSKQKCDSSYSYGYKRFSLLGAVFLSAILFASSIFVIINAVGRIITPADIEAQGMVWLAIVGIAVNGAAALRLKHGHSLNERAVFLHILEDVLGWLAVLIAAIVMCFIDLPILDPILSICISIWILFNVVHNLVDTFRIFLQNVPEGLDLQTLKNELSAIEKISEIHDLHIWSQDGESHVMTLHAVVDEDADIHDIKEALRKTALPYHIDHVTIEIEHADENCHHHCD